MGILPWQNSQLTFSRRFRNRSDANDLDALDELKGSFVIKKGYGEIPFAPNVALNPKFFGRKLGPTESSAALPLANFWARSRRRIQYALRKPTYDGPVIVSEGDSWFQYPIKLDDVIDHLTEDFNIFSLGGAGHLLSDMVLDDEFMAPIAEENATYFLISGGGNDMLGNGRLRDFLVDFQFGMSANELVHRGRFDNFLRSIRGHFEGIFATLTSTFSNLSILCHSYDYVLPRSDGKWLGVPMASRGIPKSLWKPVAKVFIDELSDVLSNLQSRFANRVFFIDCRQVVGGQTSSWDDELHPTSTGYGRVADRFKTTD